MTITATMPTSQSTVRPLLDAVAHAAREAGVFASIEVQPHAVVCHATASAAPAQYRLTHEQSGDANRLYVEVTTADRWLSHSIEADLLNTGDKLEELIDEELVELGAAPIHSHAKSKVEHFRNDSKLFVFRSLLPIQPEKAADAQAQKLACIALLAYEACFSELGDMHTDGDE